MEEIIASISRIIAEDNRSVDPVRPAPAHKAAILELTEAIEADGSVRRLTSAAMSSADAEAGKGKLTQEEKPRSPHERQKAETGSRQHHASGRYASRADAIGQPAPKGRRQPKRRRQRGKQQSGLRRADPTLRFQVEGNEEEDAEEHEVGQEAGDDTDAEGPGPKQSHLDKRRLRPGFNTKKEHGKHQCRPGTTQHVEGSLHGGAERVERLLHRAGSVWKRLYPGK